MSGPRFHFGCGGDFAADLVRRGDFAAVLVARGAFAAVLAARGAFAAVFVPLGDAIDVARECTRLGAESDRLAALVTAQEKKLGNQQFVARAPADVVAREREKLAAWSEQREVLVRKRELLGCK